MRGFIADLICGSDLLFSSVMLTFPNMERGIGDRGDDELKLSTEVFLCLFFAGVVGGLVTALTYMSDMSLSKAVIAGGAAAGAAFVWARSVIGPKNRR